MTTVHSRLHAASPYLLALLLAGAGVNHFLSPGTYDRIVPRIIPSPRAVTYASGLAELICAGLVAVPRTRRVGGWATAGLFVAVFPANIQMALDGGIPESTSFSGSATAAWLRLPVQVPLVWWAVRVAQRGARRPDVERARTPVV